jgi:hypothetical protein
MPQPTSIYTGHAGRLLLAAEQATATWQVLCDQIDALPWWRFRLRASLRRRAELQRQEAVRLIHASEIADAE